MSADTVRTNNSRAQPGEPFADYSSCLASLSLMGFFLLTTPRRASASLCQLERPSSARRPPSLNPRGMWNSGGWHWCLPLGGGGVQCGRTGEGAAGSRRTPRPLVDAGEPCLGLALGKVLTLICGCRFRNPLSYRCSE